MRPIWLMKGVGIPALSLAKWVFLRIVYVIGTISQMRPKCAKKIKHFVEKCNKKLYNLFICLMYFEALEYSRQYSY